MADKEQVLSYLKRVTADLQRTRQHVRDLEDAEREPIAIVGMSCRFPGEANTPEAFWRLLADGVDATGGYPTDRGWPSVPEGRGGFLDGATEFASGFFGISPREALEMDPQQRVLLEASWEVFENAGIDPTSLRGGRTGVFIGVNGSDYGALLDHARHESLGYLLTGTAASVVSGRLAFNYGFEGPAVTIDTACSASLVALHMASRALRSGDCPLALVGGVTVMSTPGVFSEFDKQGGMAADGRCKAFAAAADGTAWGEGVGTLLVERLSDAVRNGHRVLAVVRGSAVNQDGASNGLTAPNGPSQQRVIEDALASAALEPSDVDVVEAHGTGTTLGDPIEAQALLATYGQGRDVPLWLGSVKSNIGHTQAAAGIAGVIKMVQAMRHGLVPATLHVDEPTPHVDWSSGAVRLPTEAVPWPEADRVRRAAVSSFGISGTNAHVILEQGPVEPAAAPVEHDGVLPWPLSARTPAELPLQAARIGGFLASEDVDTAAAAAALAVRPAHEHRAVVVTDAVDRGGRLAALSELDTVRGTARADAEVAFVFSGQGSQWAGMGREWYEEIPVFAAAFDEVCAVADPALDVPLAEAITDEELLGRTEYAQIALFAIEVALHRTLTAWGVRPTVLVGHSIGEVAAAHVAGVLSLPDAVTLLVTRGALMQRLPADGLMLAMGAAEHEVAEWVAGHDDLAIAAVNGPESVVVSGAAEAVREVERRATELGRRAKYLKVGHAFHSPRMEPMLDEFRATLDGLSWSEPHTPVISTVTGAPVDAEEFMTPDYWVRHARNTVRFRDAVAALRVDTIIELGPHATLTAEIVNSAVGDDPPFVTATGHRSRQQTGVLYKAIGALWTRGVPVDWSAILPDTEARVEPPTYAFDRKRYWPKLSSRPTDMASVGLSGLDHPLLGAAVSMAEDDGVVLTGRLSTRTHPWLADHTILGSVLLPGTAFVELVLRAARSVGCVTLRELTVDTPLVLGEEATRIQVAVGPAGPEGERTVRVHARPDDDQAPWTCHVNASVGPSTGAATGFDTVSESWPPTGAASVDIDGYYAALRESGYEYGPAFQGLRAAWSRGDEIFAEVETVDETTGFGVHPALLDAALHVMGVLDRLDGSGTARVPFAWSGVRLLAVGAEAVRVAITPLGGDSVRVRVADMTGAPVMEIAELVVRPISGVRPTVTEALFTRRWEPVVPETARTEAVEFDEIEVLDCAPLPTTATDVPDRAREIVTGVLARIQEVTADEDGTSRLAVLTRSASSTRRDERVDPAQAAVLGLMRAAIAEHPHRFLLIDLDEGALPEDAPAVAVAAGEPEIAIRGGTMLAPRLVRADTGTDGDGFSTDGTVLVTGGTGMIGAAVAEHLVTEHGVTDLVVAGRRGVEAPGAREQVDRLRELGAEVRLVSCDLSEREQVADLVAGIPELRGVVHAAGIVDDGVVDALTPERVSRVLRPKAHAAWYLHETTGDLDFFVVFSSAAGVLGSPGQANYAAANTFLDGLVEYRRAEGLPGASLAWGLWAEDSGMTGDLKDVDRRRTARAGLRPLSRDEGVALFDAAVRSDDPVTVPIRLDLRASGRPPALLRRLIPAPLPSASGRVVNVERDHLRTASDVRSALMDSVREQVALVLGHGRAADIAPDETFARLGFDSLTSVELRNRLSDLTGIRLPATLVFDYPDPETLAGFLAEQYGETGAEQGAESRGHTDEPIAIVGMSCRYPGGVRSPEDLWDLLVQGREGNGAFPRDRGWDFEALHNGDGPDSTYVRQGYFLYDSAEFDPDFFGISPREAAVLDPQHRLLLELSWEAVERGGIDMSTLKGSRTGVYTGLMYHDYTARFRSVPDEAAGYLGGSSGSVATGRVAYTFGFEGPAVTVDTACSSSLVALDMAMNALRRGEIDHAIAGGVAVPSTPTVFSEFSLQRVLAPDGRCKPFSDDADGTAWGEGIGLLFVERLSDARRKGHRVLAVVRGSSVNQDGTSNGMTAPNGPAQQRVIRGALADAGLRPSDVDVVEAHGTGTRLGDPIEAQAVLATYGQRPADRPLLFGSIKSNIGHTQAAAGVAGVIKAVMAMRHGEVPPTLHVTEPSTHIDWDSGAVELVTDTVPWPWTGRPRRAAVSSFGISGTNAHVVLEQAPEAEPVPTAPAVFEPGPEVPCVLSAESADALVGQARRLRELQGADTADIAAALAGSRAAMKHRAVVLAADRRDLLRGLDAVERREYGDTVIGGTALSGTKVAFVLPGGGLPAESASWVKEWRSASPVFAESMARCAEALEAVGRPFDRGDLSEPTRWAVMVSMAELWNSLGVAPAALVGDGVTAACVSGELSLEEGARRIVEGETGDVSFEEGTRAALDAGVEIFLTMLPSPDPEMVESAGTSARVLGSGDVRRAAAALWTGGVPVDWTAMLPRRSTRVDLPTYAFQRKRYWLDAPAERGAATVPGLAPTGHPLLTGAVVPAGTDTLLLTGEFSLETHAWLADHAVHGTVLVPGSVFLDWALDAGERLDLPTIDELTTRAPLILDPGLTVQVQVHASAPDTEGRRALTVHSRPSGEDEAVWTRHVEAVLSAESPDTGTGDKSTAWPPPEAERVELGDFYGDLVEHGYLYGPAFRGLRAAWRTDTDVFAEVSLPGGDGFALHPALLDAAFHAMGIGTFLRQEADQVLLPSSWSGVRRHAAATAARVRISSIDDNTVGVSLFGEGGPVVDIGRVELTPVPADILTRVRRQGTARSTGAVDERGAVLRAMAPEERIEPLIRLAQEELAILRRDDVLVDPRQELIDAGVDSMLGIELTERLGVVLGVRLAQTTLVENPSIGRLAEHLSLILDTEPEVRHRTEPARAPAGVPAGRPFDAVEEMYRESHRLGAAGTTGMELIRVASRMRGSFTVDDLHEHVPPAAVLARAGERTRIVCLPAITATAGPVQYARMSRLFRGEREVVVLPNPGYIDDESVPDSFRTFIALQVEALRRAVGDEPFVLMGHSAGGLIAYAVAGAAERAGLKASGVVLIDTFGADSRFSEKTTSVMVDGLFAREHILGPDAMSGWRLTAMGRYYTLMEECELDTVTSPTLFLRAEEPLPHQDDDGDDWQPGWPFPHTLATAPGDHFTLMEDHIAETAGIVEKWLADLDL